MIAHNKHKLESSILIYFYWKSCLLEALHRLFSIQIPFLSVQITLYLCTMPAVPTGYSSGGQMNKPTCFDRIKIGFTMGFTVGMVTGIVFGGVTGLRSLILRFISFLN
jgi:hypothetical protein